MISIIVPIYNVENFLDQCIKSILEQTYKELEIILVDDGSTDRSSEICDFYSRLDERIIVIHKENGGLVSARKAGLMKSKGEYIGFVDGDDWIEPNMYEELYKKVIEEEVDIVLSGRYEDVGNVSRNVLHGFAEGRYDKKALEEKIYPQMIVNENFFAWGIFPGLWDKLFKRQSIFSYQLQVCENITMGEDAAVVYPCMLQADNIYIIGRSFYHYRQSTNTMMKQKPDLELERNRFKLLYWTVRETLSAWGNQYNILNQWKEYVLFLMVARADNLYNDYDKLGYLYPFPNVKRGSKIVLYGAGTYGQRLYHYLKDTGFCDVILWVDSNFEQLRGMGFDVYAPDTILKCEYDQIVVAVTYAKTRSAIYSELIKYVEEKKISLIDVDLIKSDSSLRAFGLQ